MALQVAQHLSEETSNHRCHHEEQPKENVPINWDNPGLTQASPGGTQGLPRDYPGVTQGYPGDYPGYSCAYPGIPKGYPGPGTGIRQPSGYPLGVALGLPTDTQGITQDTPGVTEGIPGARDQDHTGCIYGHECSQQCSRYQSHASVQFYHCLQFKAAGAGPRKE